MTSIERTAYPRFKRVISAGELHGHFKPTREEVSWASQRTDSDGHLLALVLALKCFQRMGGFPRQHEVPGQVVDHVRRALGSAELSPPSDRKMSGYLLEREKSPVTRRVTRPWCLRRSGSLRYRVQGDDLLGRFGAECGVDVALRLGWVGGLAEGAAGGAGPGDGVLALETAPTLVMLPLPVPADP